jgi:hypothetical protein
VQQGVDADGAGRRGAAEDRLQVRERIGEMGKGARRPDSGGGRLDQDGEECLGIRRLGIDQPRSKLVGRTKSSRSQGSPV